MLQPTHFSTPKIERRQQRELADAFSIEVKPAKPSHVFYQHPPLKKDDPIMKDIGTQTHQINPLSREDVLSVLQQHDEIKRNEKIKKSRRRNVDKHDINEFQGILVDERREERKEKVRKYIGVPAKETLKIIAGTAVGIGIGGLASHMFG